MKYRNRPSASAWYVGRDFVTHHNLREGSVEDVRRLVRGLTGDATVVVFGGGGARGFAHLGVIRARLGKLDGAREAWETVLRLSPGQPHALANLRQLEQARQAGDQRR